MKKPDVSGVKEETTTDARLASWASAAIDIRVQLIDAHPPIDEPGHSKKLNSIHKFMKYRIL